MERLFFGPWFCIFLSSAWAFKNLNEDIEFKITQTHCNKKGAVSMVETAPFIV